MEIEGRRRSDALVRAQIKYRLNHLEKIREIANRSARRYGIEHREAILASKKSKYEWFCYINNSNFKKEAKTFREILL